VEDRGQKSEVGQFLIPILELASAFFKDATVPPLLDIGPREEYDENEGPDSEKTDERVLKESVQKVTHARYDGRLRSRTGKVKQEDWIGGTVGGKQRTEDRGRKTEDGGRRSVPIRIGISLRSAEGKSV
jgi:hypothetical protein